MGQSIVQSGQTHYLQAPLVFGSEAREFEDDEGDLALSSALDEALKRVSSSPSSERKRASTPMPTSRGAKKTRSPFHGLRPLSCK